MATTVVGFRLGAAERDQQVTIVVTEKGLLHRAHGRYGKQGRVSRPSPPVGENPVHARVGDLRAQYASYRNRGYKELIGPASVQLDVDEPVPHHHPYGENAPPPDPELFAAFAAAAPASRRLEDAIRAFYQAIGAPH